MVLLHGPEEFNKFVPMKPWKDGTPIDPKLEYALDLYLTVDQRPYIEASLMSCEDNEIIARSFHFDVEEVQYYRHLFFDTTVFRNLVQKFAYIRDKVPEETLAKQLFEMAYNNGFGAIRYHFTPNKELIDEEEVLRMTMTDAYFRAQAHRGRPLTHKITKESLKWAQTAVTCSKMLMKDDGPTQGPSDFKFKFTEGTPTTDINKLETKGIKVLH